MLVELHVFSGRPNPTLDLDDQAIGVLRELHGALRTTPRAPPVAPGLGYSGFSYVIDGQRVVAYDGFVRTPRAVLNDPGHSVEKFLLDFVPAEHAVVRDRIRAQLDR